MAKTIYIAGLGLIGASMALGIKRNHPDYEILGYNRSQASQKTRFVLKRLRSLKTSIIQLMKNLKNTLSVVNTVQVRLMA